MTLYDRINRKFRLGLRDVIRRRLQKKVAFTAPSPPTNGSTNFSAHSLVCHQDLLLAVCSAKSLNLAADSALPWMFHDDGTLTSLDKGLLNLHFPGCRVIGRKEADSFFDINKSKYPFISKLRRKHVMLIKLADLSAYSDKAKILYCDSDVLFFRRPDFLLSKLSAPCDGNYFNRDTASVYIANPSIIKNLVGIEPPEKFNAGLSILNKEDISLEKIEQVLTQLDERLRTDWVQYSHLIEQTSVALLTALSSGGTRPLPEPYDVSLTKPACESVCKHYVGVIRHQYEIEGLRYLLETKSFLKKWQTFVK